MVVKLMQNSASLGHLDHEGNSVFHFAATQNRDIINVSLLLVKIGKQKKIINQNLVPYLCNIFIIFYLRFVGKIGDFLIFSGIIKW